MLDLLRSKLQPLQLADPQGAGTADLGPLPEAKAAFTVNSGGGHGGVVVTVHRIADPVDLNASDLLCPPVTGDITSCTRTEQANGSYLMVTKSDDTTPGGHQIIWSVQSQRPDGIVVIASAGNNELAHPTLQPYLGEPPLTTDRLAVLATDGSWLQVGATLAASAGSTHYDPKTQTWLAVPLDQIMQTATPLLPAGLTPADVTGEPAFANFTLDDGGGRSLVRIIAQDWSVYQQTQFSGPDIDSEFTDAVQLPGGDRITSGDGPSYYPGVVEDEVSVLRPDHLLIRVQCFNGTAFDGGVTRQRPLLTLDQLRTIALSPTWNGPARTSGR